MINLIPPQAKRLITREYWSRVVVVWLFLLSGSLVLCAVMLTPAYVLVTSQLQAFALTNNVPVEDMQTFQDIKTDVETANAAARLLTTDVITRDSHELVSAIEELSPITITFVGFDAKRDRSGFTNVTMRGFARDRASLVAYQEAVIAHEFFETAELPLSNFAEREDISFVMSITVAEDITYDE